jgi:flagellar hook-associated protein 2
MGTVGINFGTATGGSGFDVASTVTQILGIQQAIETPWKNQLATLQGQDTALSTIGTDLSTLTTSLQTLTDFSGVMAQKQGSSSNPDVLSLGSASASAVAGTHTVEVDLLAQTSSDYSDTLSTSDTLSGSLTIQVGSGESQTINIDSSNDTLSSLAASINSADIGVTASVISDSTGSRLSIVSGTGGAAGQLSISSSMTDDGTGAAVGFHTGQVGKDASFTVDGVALTSGTNTVTDAIPGVTFQLLSADVGTPVQVVIANDNSAVESAFSSLVTAYNAVVKDINTQEGKDASGNAEPLYGSPTLALIQSQLSGALLGGAASGSISNVTRLGISVNNDGTLTLNQDTLNSALNNNFSDVVGFLQNAGSFGQNFGAALNTMGTQAPNGLVYMAQQQNSTQEASLNKNISDQEARIADQKTTLTNELNAANEILQSIPEQLKEVDEMYSAITGYNTGNG